MSSESNFEVLELIGKGSYGTVRKVRDKSDGKILVRKEIEYNSMNSHERNQLVAELRILIQLNHKNIVKYYHHDHIMEKKTLHIYMEYCDGGDLANVIKTFKQNKEFIPEEFIWQILIQVLLALHRCHYGIDAAKVNLFSSSVEKPPSIDSETVIIHRDIKPDNVLLMGDKSVKLGDFGLAKMLTSQNDFAKTSVGTPYYMSPEVLMDNPYSPVCDIWSLGCVLYELCSLNPPFQAKTYLQLQTKIKEGKYAPLPDNYSQQLRSIIDACITINPEKRPTCFMLLDQISIRLIRKEMELKEHSKDLSEFQNQLLKKNDELKKKETLINNLEKKIYNERENLDIEYNNLQKKFNLERKKMEDELLEEFDSRKKLMEMEAKDVRLGYLREFKLVVEQEVQSKLKEILAMKQQQQQQNLLRKKSDPTSRTIQVQRSHETPHSEIMTQSPSQYKLKGPRDLQMEETSSRRSPLKNRNDDFDSVLTTHRSATQLTSYSTKKRMTDELERINSGDRRRTPDYEEIYAKKNYGYP